MPIIKLLKKLLSSIAYSKTDIPLINIFVKLRYFSCYVVSYNLISYFRLFTNLVFAIKVALLVDFEIFLNFRVTYLVNKNIFPAFTEPMIISLIEFILFFLLLAFFYFFDKLL